MLSARLMTRLTPERFGAICLDFFGRGSSVVEA
jgi:hypothetical protein